MYIYACFTAHIIIKISLTQFQDLHRIPVEPVIAALTDPVSYVRCAAVETLGLMGKRVPLSVYLVLQKMAGFDDSAHVRQRATRTLLLLHGMTPAPLTLPIIDIT